MKSDRSTRAERGAIVLLRHFLHAGVRGDERFISHGDIVYALGRATYARRQVTGRWVFGGRDRDGDALELVVAFESEAYVVTAYRKFLPPLPRR